MLAEEAFAAAETTAGLPPATVQLIYRIEPRGRRAAGGRSPHRRDARSRAAASGGLALKAAADKAGKPIYLEMSSVNPVVILPGALAERGAKVAEEFAGSCLMGGGQFCTNPGLVILLAGDATEQIHRSPWQNVRQRRASAAALRRRRAVARRQRADASSGRAPSSSLPGARRRSAARHPNTLLRVSGEQFLAEPEKLQTEAFGSAALLVVARDVGEAAARDRSSRRQSHRHASIRTRRRSRRRAVCRAGAAVLRERVGRLLNDKMPTGVAVSPAMNHGGPFPATGHPGFTAVGIPASLRRFAALHCYDNVRANRLPPALQR